MMGIHAGKKVIFVMTISLPLFLSCFFGTVWAGEIKVHEVYYTNKPEQLLERFTYDADIGPENGKEGLYEQWYIDGTLRIRADYHLGKLHGLYTQCYENGSIFIESHYDAGELHGAYKEWHYNGQVFIETAYNKGKINGLRTEWDYSGQKRIEETYLNGVLNGAFKKWNGDGKIVMEGAYKNGLLEGTIIRNDYFPYEIETLETQYLNGKKHGIEKFWLTLDGPPVLQRINEYFDGLLVKEMTSNGELVREYAYDADGNLSKKISYGWSGQDTVEWRIFYDPEGVEIRKTTVYWWGIAVVQGGTATVMQREEDCHYPDGLLAYCHVAYWHENGNLSYKWDWDANQKHHGLYTQWYANAQKQEEGNYIHGVKDGVWKTWHEDGNPASEKFFTAGRKNGVFTEWHPNGQMKSKGAYVNDLEEGLWETWTDAGQPFTQTMWRGGRKNGVDKEWQGTCQVREETFVNDLKEGPAIYYSWWYPSEKPMECYLSGKGSYKNDLKDGAWKTWKYDRDRGYVEREEQWEKGVETQAVERVSLMTSQNVWAVYEETNYRYGKKHGIASKWEINWSETGNPMYLRLKIQYQYGVRHGIHVGYDSQNRITESGQYSNDQQCGVWRYGVENQTTQDFGPCGPLAVDPNDDTLLPFIDGVITDGQGVGIADVKIMFDGLNPVYTDGSGYYIRFVPKGWSGTATPVDPGYAFNPPSRTYANVSQYSDQQHYSGTKVKKGLRIWTDKDRSGVFDAGEGIEGALVFVNNVNIGETDANGWILAPVVNTDRIYACKEFYSMDNPKAHYDNFASHAVNPYFASDDDTAIRGKMYAFVMTSDIMASDGDYHEFPGPGKTLRDAHVDGDGNLLVPLVHPQLEWNLTVAFEQAQSNDFYQMVKAGFMEYSDYMANVTDGYSIIKNVVLIKGAYKDTVQWDFCDVQIKNQEHPNAHIFGNRENLIRHIHMGKAWGGHDPDLYNWYSTLMHESGHYLFGFYDEYLNGTGFQAVYDGRWSYRISRDGDRGEPNEFPKNYGLMDSQYIAHEMSDITDYFPRAYSAAMHDDLVTMQYKQRKGESCWAYFKTFFQNDIKAQFQHHAIGGFSNTFFDHLIIPPHNAGGYPTSNSTKRLKPTTVKKGHEVHFIEFVVPEASNRKQTGGGALFDATALVTDAGGKPLPDADIWLISGDDRHFQNKTDANGKAGCGSLQIGKRIEAYRDGVKGSIDIKTVEKTYTIVLPLDQKRGGVKNQGEAGMVVSAKPDSDNPKWLHVTVSGNDLPSAPPSLLTQSDGYSVAINLSGGPNVFSGDGSCRYDSGNIEVGGDIVSINAFAVFNTEAGPASGFYAPNAELEMTHEPESFDHPGAFVMLVSSAPAPPNGDLVQVGKVYSLGFAENVGAVKNIGLSIPLAQTQLAGLDAGGLNLYGWDAATQTWHLVAGGDTDLKYFRIDIETLDHVSLALFAPRSGDVSPPEAVTDLKALTGESRWRVALEWTAPSDNGNPVFTYDIRFHTKPVTEENWDDAVSVPMAPEPATPGTAQEFIVEMPDPNTMYYFAMRSADAAGNWSSPAVLNGPVRSTPIGDLNGDSQITLADLILGMQVAVHITTDPDVLPNDINGDQRVGLAEILYMMKVIAAICEQPL